MLCSRPYKPSTSVGSNPVHRFSSRDVWRVQVGIHSLVLVDKLWFGIRMGLKFSFFGFTRPGFGLFLTKVDRSSGIWRGSNGFKVWFRWTNLGSSEFKVRLVKFEVI